MSWIQMRDFWTFRPTEVQENKKHLFECRDSKSDTGHSLLVHVAATHSGIVNGNRRFYRPDRMQEGVHTWLPHKDEDGTVLRTARPVLIGHDEKGEVLGRVLEAKYIDTSWKYANDFPIVKDFLFYQRDSRKRHSLRESVEWITDNLAPLPNYTGMGYTDLGLRITNPNAIRKVFNDEYLTVSVGFNTDAAICSLCYTDWAKDGQCGHKIGQKEDGKSMFLITGSVINKEVSFVNFPADPFATTLSKETLTDSLEKMFFLGLPIQKQDSATANGFDFSDGQIFDLALSVADDPKDSDTPMSKFDFNALAVELKSSELTKDRAFEIKDLLAAWAPETEELRSKKRSLVSTTTAKMRKNKWDKIADEISESEKAVADELTAMMDTAAATPEVAAEVNEPILVDSWDLKGADAEYFADREGVDGEVAAALGAELVRDANTFCGPNETFPVCDGAQGEAALKVIASAPISQELKDSITSNVQIRLKALGHDITGAAGNTKAPSTSASVDTEDSAITALVDAAVAFKDAEGDKATPETRKALVTCLQDLDAKYKSLGDAQWALRYSMRALLDHWSADEQLASALTYLQGKDYVGVLKSEMDEKDEAIEGLVSEKDSLATEVEALKTSRSQILATHKQSLAQQIVMHGVLSGQDSYKDLTAEQRAEKIETLSKRHITSLRDTLSDAMAGLKFTDSTPAAPKSTETAEAVDDNTQIADEAPTTDPVLEVKDEAEQELMRQYARRARYMEPTALQRWYAKQVHDLKSATAK